ncbi:hypothetical protein J5N97_029202 [Dioscorea zingiberensis]|uniref:Protein yippee-like n=1 Tax=Dioscorea zingiberensis TaxID=325984 RepID=A0A9D5H5N7_9LILI|nr:hypothetical protein J5N97_029202 [Dioscorea zingiberensis]
MQIHRNSSSLLLSQTRYAYRQSLNRWPSLMDIQVGPRIYSCSKCSNHVSLHDDIISKCFQGRSGRAFLFSHAMNVTMGTKENRQLITGMHTVADIHCSDCHELLGWKYIQAYAVTQKYKEGKFILEKAKIVKENW